MEEIDYGQENENDVALDEGSEKFTRKHDEWLKFTKGQVVRASFVYFSRYDLNAVIRVRAAAKKAGEVLAPEQLKMIGRKAIEARAAQLNKTVGQLDNVDMIDIADCKFKQFMYHYQAPLGYITSKLDASGRTKEGVEADKVWKSLEEPKQGFSTLLLIYPTNAKGEIGESEKNRILTDWRLVPWRFSKRTFEDIWKSNAGLRENNLSLSTQDIKIECKEPQYQQVGVSFVGQAIWQRNEKFRRQVLEAALPMWDKLLPFKEMSTAQLREKLGLDGPSGVSDVSMARGAVPDFNDMLDRV
jgi:hypothetical protein